MGGHSGGAMMMHKEPEGSVTHWSRGLGVNRVQPGSPITKPASLAHKEGLGRTSAEATICRAPSLPCHPGMTPREHLQPLGRKAFS